MRVPSKLSLQLPIKQNAQPKMDIYCCHTDVNNYNEGYIKYMIVKCPETCFKYSVAYKHHKNRVSNTTFERQR